MKRVPPYWVFRSGLKRRNDFNHFSFLQSSFFRAQVVHAFLRKDDFPFVRDLFSFPEIVCKLLFWAFIFFSIDSYSPNCSSSFWSILGEFPHLCFSFLPLYFQFLFLCGGLFAEKGGGCSFLHLFFSFFILV